LRDIGPAGTETVRQFLRAMIDRDDPDKVLETILRPPARPQRQRNNRCDPGCSHGPTPPRPADDAPHLLLVDDDRRIRDLLSRFLCGEGYRVTTAMSAKDARAKLAGLHFDS